MRADSLAARVYDLVFREFPHIEKTGLFRLGNPGRNSPVLVTGNYTLTVRRMKNELNGVNAWLLVANSKGINVWCAAGGGHFTHHDVISAIITSEIDQKVDHRRLILPQLSATGIEKKKISEATGWDPVWGPARLEDLREYLTQGHNASPYQRFMRFPLWERMEMATMWGIPMIGIGFLFFFLLGGWRTGLAVAEGAALISYGIFGMLPWLIVKGRKRWITFAAFGTLAFLLGVMTFLPLHWFTTKNAVLVAIGSAVEMAVLSVDLAGTTPWYGSYINTFRNHATIDLIADRCNGSADCVQVCPRKVLEMNGHKKKVDIKAPEDCIECGACIVQCPTDALLFRYQDGRVVEAATIRSTRMNMLGRRTVIMGEDPGNSAK